MMKNQKLINTDIEINLPIIKSSKDISFGALQYVESVIEALLAAKKENGQAWVAGQRLLDVTVDRPSNNVTLTLKVHGIDTDHVNAPSILTCDGCRRGCIDWDKCIYND